MATVCGRAMRWLYIVVMCIHLCVSLSSLTLVQMDQLCGETLNLSTPVLLRLTSKGDNYQPNMQCGLNLAAHSGDRLIIGVRSVNIHVKSNTTCHDFLDILAVYESSSHSMSGIICHNNTYPTKSMRTLQSKAKVWFTSDSTGEDMGFELLVTPFHTGYCSKNEYDCRSSQCIPIDVNFVNCNTSYNYCGDDSDYCPKSDNTDLFALTYVVTAVIPTLLTVALCTCLCTCRKTGKQKNIRSNASAEHISESPDDECRTAWQSTATSLNPPDYSPPIPPPPYSSVRQETAHIRNKMDIPTSHLSGREGTLDETAPPSYSEICG